MAVSPGLSASGVLARSRRASSATAAAPGETRGNQTCVKPASTAGPVGRRSAGTLQSPSTPLRSDIGAKRSPAESRNWIISTRFSTIRSVGRARWPSERRPMGQSPCRNCSPRLLPEPYRRPPQPPILARRLHALYVGRPVFLSLRSAANAPDKTFHFPRPQWARACRAP